MWIIFSRKYAEKANMFQSPRVLTLKQQINLEYFGVLKNLKQAYQIFHKSVISIMKVCCKKRLSRMIKDKDYKMFSNKHFKNFVNKNLANTKLDYNISGERVLNLLSL